ncbi:hypothetical protein C4J81_13730 [Deltaproteobacteria bacterium Smac51]|nr:hypothetical protein C4J81_13730 [Deltaproteobacteria bacterium Smac51]
MAFKFQNNNQTIEIEGWSFEVKIGDIETAEAIARAEVAAKASVDGNFSKNDDPTGLRVICREIGQQIDMILGPGSYEKIFQGRAPNLREHMDIVSYITGELTRFNEERDRAILGRSVSPGPDDDSVH